jgi:hypothetical protein
MRLAARTRSAKQKPRPVRQHDGVKLRARLPRRREIAGEKGPKPSTLGNAGDFRYMAFDEAAGRKRHAIENVNRLE